MDNYTLQHHGVKGMKWGVRKQRDTSGAPRGRRARKAYEAEKLRNMSDKELREHLNRMRMESEYKQMTKKKTSAGRKFVQDVLLNAGKQVATQYVAKLMTKGVDAGVAKGKAKYDAWKATKEAASLELDQIRIDFD